MTNDNYDDRDPGKKDSMVTARKNMGISTKRRKSAPSVQSVVTSSAGMKRTQKSPTRIT